MRRLRGGVKLAGVRGGAAVAFCGVGARSKQKGEKNGLLGLLWCSCARQRGSGALPGASHGGGEVAAAEPRRGGVASC